VSKEHFFLHYLTFPGPAPDFRSETSCNENIFAAETGSETIWRVGETINMAAAFAAISAIAFPLEVGSDALV
jgi:hypothetical protein